MIVVVALGVAGRARACPMTFAGPKKLPATSVFTCSACVIANVLTVLTRVSRLSRCIQEIHSMR
jgi:hypothetical protein